MRLTHVYKLGFGQEDEEPETYAENSYAFRQDPENYPGSGDQRVIVDFKEFGDKKRHSNYQVDLNWMDFKSILETFVEAGDGHAIHLMKILKNARHLSEAGWHNDKEPSEFWEGLIED